MEWISDGDASLPPLALLERVGEVFATFDSRTQDSGNVSYGLKVGPRRFFVKTAGDPADRRTLLDHPARVALLDNAVAIAAEVEHPALPRLYGVMESAHGPMVVYEWRDGRLLHGMDADGQWPLARFQRLPVEEVCRSLDVVIELHEDLAAAGRIALDFYDGCLIYDFDARRLSVIDLDTYRNGPSHNDMGRMFGSSRFMAPEEFTLGAPIDERTTVFNLGRTVQLLLAHWTEQAEHEHDLRVLLHVAERACRHERAQRFTSVAELAAAWRAARGA